MTSNHISAILRDSDIDLLTINLYQGTAGTGDTHPTKPAPIFPETGDSDAGNGNNDIPERNVKQLIQKFENKDVIAGTSHSIKKKVTSNCILPVDTFTGRVAELEHLVEKLQTKGVAVVAGMGGIGKTQLARALVKNTTYYMRPYWLPGETSKILNESVLGLAKELRIKTDPSRDTNLILKELYNKLTKDKCLLIFDNIEEQEDVHAFLPRTLGFNTHVLITTRRTNWSCQNIEVHTLEPFSSTEALQLFQNVFGKDLVEPDKQRWLQLAEELGRLPLALKVAANHIKYFSLPVSEYLTQLKKFDETLYMDKLPEYEKKTIYTSLLMSVEKLEDNQDPKSLLVKIMNVAGYLNPEKIVKKYLSSLVSSDDDDLSKALTTLCDLSVLSKSNCRHYSIHRVMQRVIRYHQSAELADEYYKLALRYAMIEHNWRYGAVIYRCVDQTVFRYANEKAEAISQYYEEHPISILLDNLIRNGCSIALKVILQKQNDPEKCRAFLHENNLLQCAASDNNADMLELLLTFGANINQAGEYGETPLHSACNKGHMAMIELLLKHGADITSTDSIGWTPAHEAVNCVQPKVIDFLFAKDRNLINARDHQGHTPFEVISDDLEKINEASVITLLKVFQVYSIDITQIRACDGGTILYTAVKAALSNLVSYILELNEDLLKMKDTRGRLPLHAVGGSALCRNEAHINIIDILIKHGQSLEERDDEGRTVLHYAAAFARPLVISYILEVKSDLTRVRDNHGRSALHVIGDCKRCVLYDDIASTIQVLEQHGLPLEEKDSQGRTLLHHAARNGQPRVISYILEKKRDLIRARDNQGRSPLHVIGEGIVGLSQHIARGDYLIECVRLLIGAGLSSYVKDNEGRTPSETISEECQYILKEL